MSALDTIVIQRGGNSREEYLSMQPVFKEAEFKK